MKRLIAFTTLLWALGASLALAQSPVITQPYGANNYNDSSTITATNTFQSIWAASTLLLDVPIVLFKIMGQLVCLFILGLLPALLLPIV